MLAMFPPLSCLLQERMNSQVKLSTDLWISKILAHLRKHYLRLFGILAEKLREQSHTEPLQTFFDLHQNPRSR